MYFTADVINSFYVLRKELDYQLKYFLKSFDFGNVFYIFAVI